jgi:hypothetical protein
MKKILFAAIALFSLSGAALADSFDINSMPLGGIKPALDNGATGSVAAKNVFKRVIKRGKASVTQYYAIAKDGAAIVLSEETY